MVEATLFRVAHGLCLFLQAGVFDFRKPSEQVEDAMIAATARVPGLEVATGNERDFRQFQGETFHLFCHGA